MKVTVFRVRLMALLLLLLGAGTVWSIPYIQTTATELGQLQIHFLDVGQGDAILVVTPQGDQVLIDGGPDSSVLTELSTRMPFSDRTIELVVGTHPDTDHIGGLVDVLNQYEVLGVVRTEALGEGGAATAWEEAIKAEAATVHMARAGEVYSVGASTTIEILSPHYDPSQLDKNAGSIIILLKYGTTSFLLTGDAPRGVEDYLVDTYGQALQADVLKLGHHGSDTSSSDRFLKAVQPQFAIISAGVNNHYGHPDGEVLTRVFKNTSAQILSTQHGAITIKSDGADIWLE